MMWYLLYYVYSSGSRYYNVIFFVLNLNIGLFITKRDKNWFNLYLKTGRILSNYAEAGKTIGILRNE